MVAFPKGKAVIFSKPSSLPLKRKRLVGGPNDPGMILQGKRKASSERRVARQVKMCIRLERNPKLVLPVSFIPPSSGDTLEPSLVGVLVPRAPFAIEVDFDEFDKERPVQNFAR
ncbi:hypothetical protein ACOSQ4_021419 [Xanthoceras sorbifolium]